MRSVRRLSVLGYAAVLVLAVQLGRSASAGGSAGPIPFDGGTIHQPLKIASGTAASNYFDFADSTGAPLSASGHGTIEYINGTGFRASVNGGAYATLVTGSAASTFQQVYDASTGPPMINMSGYTMQFQSATATMGNFGADDACMSLIRSGSNSANPIFEALAISTPNNSADGIRITIGSNAGFVGAGIRIVNSGDGAGIDMTTTTNGDTALLGVGVKIKCVASAGILFADGGGAMGGTTGQYHISGATDRPLSIGTRNSQPVDFYSVTTKIASLTSVGKFVVSSGGGFATRGATPSADQLRFGDGSARGATDGDIIGPTDKTLWITDANDEGVGIAGGTSHNGQVVVSDSIQINAPQNVLVTSGAGAYTRFSGDEVQFVAPITKVSGVVTAGKGVPAIYAAASSTAQTGNVTGLATFTPAADGDFEVSESINVTAYTAGTLAGTVTYKDEGGTARTLTLNFSSVGGTLGPTVGAAGAYEGVSLHIRAQASTAIVYQVTGTAFTGTYNVRACTRQLQ